MRYSTNINPWAAPGAGGLFYVAVPAGPLVVQLGAYSPTDLSAPVHVLRRGIVLASLLSLVVATLLAALLAQRCQATGSHRGFRQSHRLRGSDGPCGRGQSG